MQDEQKQENKNDDNLNQIEKNNLPIESEEILSEKDSLII